MNATMRRPENNKKYKSYIKTYGEGKIQGENRANDDQKVSKEEPS